MASLYVVRRAINTEAGFGEKLVRSSLAVLIPTVLRWLIDRGSLGAPFILYFPAILIVSVLFGWRWATFTAVGCILATLAFFTGAGQFAQPAWGATAIVTLYVLSAGLMIGIGDGLRKAVIQVEQQARLLEQFNDELQHRTKNIFQMVRALASRAARSTDPTIFYKDLGGRLDALAKANELLRFGAVQSCSTTDLVRSALAPFSQDRITARGPDCKLSNNSCTPLVLALHELGTNASKYGALSTDEGSVEIEWALEDEQTVRITWIESGGPPVSPPVQAGFGTRLLVPQGDLRAVDLKFHPAGVRCVLSAARAPNEDARFRSPAAVAWMGARHGRAARRSAG